MATTSGKKLCINCISELNKALTESNQVAEESLPFSESQDFMNNDDFSSESQPLLTPEDLTDRKFRSHFRNIIFISNKTVFSL